MAESYFNTPSSPLMGVNEVQVTLRISKSKAYQIIKQLNDELSKNGFITIQGKVSKRYFEERVAL